MPGTPPDDPNHLSSGTASITVLALKPVKLGRIFALASVEIDLDGVLRHPVVAAPGLDLEVLGKGSSANSTDENTWCLNLPGEPIRPHSATSRF